MIGGGASILGGMSATIGLSACNPFSVAFSFGLTCVVAGAVVAGTAVGAYVYGNHVARHTRCPLDEGSIHAGGDEYGDDYYMQKSCE